MISKTHAALPSSTFTSKNKYEIAQRDAGTRPV